MRYPTIREVTELHRLALEQFGGASGLRDRGGLESALSQPAMTFSGEDLYATVVDKAAALCFSLVMNHPFLDGNRRVGHFAMETFLVLNGYEIHADVDEQEAVILRLADGGMKQSEFTQWLAGVIDPISLQE